MTQQHQTCSLACFLSFWNDAVLVNFVGVFLFQRDLCNMHEQMQTSRLGRFLIEEKQEMRLNLVFI